MKQESGFVSLMTCVFISLLLVIVTVSMISLEALQLRKAGDAEQTARAYYAAEAGIEDAVSKILTKQITTNQTCKANTAYDTDGAAGWTCQQVSFSGVPEGKLDEPDQAKTIDPLRPSPVYNTVVVEWNESDNADMNYYNMNLLNGFPTQSEYTKNLRVPPVELSIVEYPDTSFAANDARLKLQNALIVPGGSRGIPGATIDYANLKNHGPWYGDCGRAPRVTPWGQSKYNCYAVITNFNTSNNYLFRIRARYSASSYRLTFRTGVTTGEVVQVPDGMATIDVTAKAGQTYRRVVSKLPIVNGASAGLNYVMYSDTDICKNFDVIDGQRPNPYPC